MDYFFKNFLSFFFLEMKEIVDERFPVSIFLFLGVEFQLHAVGIVRRLHSSQSCDCDVYVGCFLNIHGAGCSTGTRSNVSSLDKSRKYILVTPASLLGLILGAQQGAPCTLPTDIHAGCMQCTFLLTSKQNSSEPKATRQD